MPPQGVILMPNTDSLSRTLFVADNLPILRGLDSESVDLIATDPPFNKGVRAFEGIVTAGAGREGRKVSYKDTWTWGDVQEDWTEAIKDDHPNLYAVIQAANVAAGEDMGAFLCWLGVRVLEMQRVLKPTGSLYLHIDHTAHAYAKAMLDAIFGRANFTNELVWCYEDVGGRATPYFKRKHDTILLYNKSKNATFHIQRKGLSDSTIKRYSKYFDENGQITYADLQRTNPGVFRKLKGVPEDLGKVWLDINDGSPLNDWWSDISAIKRGFGEAMGYPTQKPLALYERIIKASSNEGDMVLDPFAGCATTCVAAEKLGREWIAIDINEEAEQVTKERLQKEARLPLGSRSWNRAVHVRTRAPRRTDDGEKAAPELGTGEPTAAGPPIYGAAAARDPCALRREEVPGMRLGASPRGVPGGRPPGAQVSRRTGGPPQPRAALRAMQRRKGQQADPGGATLAAHRGGPYGRPVVGSGVV